MAEADGIKVCSGCKQAKQVQEFGKRSSQKDGLNYYCRACQAKSSKETYERNIVARRHAMRNYALANVGAHRERSSRWHKDNRDVSLEKKARYREENRDRLNAKAAQARDSAEERLKNTQRAKLWAKENREKRSAQCASRKAQKIRAMPVWADRQSIADVYRGARSLSKRLGLVFHVDHIVPLKSKFVCGLHVPANLQVLSGELNMAKSNCYWPDMP